MIETMLAALAAAKKDSSLRLNWQQAKMGVDVYVAVDGDGEIIGDESVNPKDPKTWPCVVMLFGSDIAVAEQRVKDGANPMSVPPCCSRVYAWDPFNPPKLPRLMLVGTELRPGASFVKVAERQVHLPAPKEGRGGIPFRL